MEKIFYEGDFHPMEERLKTFKDWPFTENCACTPEKLAEAGFIYCGSSKEPDLVRCYVCFKELDGWEPEDDPWQEHVSHSNKCPFIKNNNPKEMTFKDFISLEKTRMLNSATRYFQESNSLWNQKVSAIEELLGSQGKLQM
ncbi:baculoviral IAP repeat-containing protein 5 [Hetaerina americana]|uniref:baculoviral IAP repeat-containing protein 5 n=1 Tax=Hetaerina americana TaxID=62018 RepID=UPI003A7F6162